MNTENPFDRLSNQIENLHRKIDAALSGSIERQQPEKKFLSIKECAEKLNVSEITLYRGTKSGKVPSRKIGSRTVIPASYLQQK